MLSGIKDCAGGSQYHNRKFKEQAEKFGLVVNKMKGKGYASTQLGGRSKELVDKYKSDILKGTNPFDIHRVTTVKTSITSPKKAVMIDKSLITQIEEKFGDKISVAVDSILREYIDHSLQVC